MKHKKLVAHSIMGDKNTPLPDYDTIRLVLSDQPCDYIDVRVSRNSDSVLEIKCGTGGIVVRPLVSNVIEVTRTLDRW